MCIYKYMCIYIYIYIYTHVYIYICILTYPRIHHLPQSPVSATLNKSNSTRTHVYCIEQLLASVYASASASASAFGCCCCCRLPVLKC